MPPMAMVPLLLDINGPEFALLLVLAVILFGPERLPDLARKTARIVNYLRNAAGSAQEQLTKELGPGFENLDFRDLNPKQFVQKHLLSDSIVADVRAEFDGVGDTLKDGHSSVAGAIEQAKDTSPGGPYDAMADSTPARRTTPFDPDAT